MTKPNDYRDPRNYIGPAAIATFVILAIVLFNVDPTTEQTGEAPPAVTQNGQS